MSEETDGSVTRWVGSLKQGEGAAVQPLWERYFERLVRLARGRLAGGRSLAADEEDVVLSVFDSFCRAAAAGRFPKLDDRDDLWRLLVAMTLRKAINLRKRAGRQKHGANRVLDEHELAAHNPWAEGVGLDAVLGAGPTPELAAALADRCRDLLEALDREDSSGTLRRVALAKLEGCTNREIAKELGCASRTVDNRLKLIRSLWAGIAEP